MEALKNAIDLDPMNFNALELVDDVARRRGAGSSYVHTAIKRMVELLPLHPEAHREALDFVIPRASGELHRLTVSPDPVVRAVVRLHGKGRATQEWKEEAIADACTSEQIDLAQSLYALGRGRSSEATALLRSLESKALPARSIRRAARRALLKGDNRAANRLLEQYLRHSPNDVWARSKYEEWEPGELTERELIQKGFPFSTTTPEVSTRPRGTGRRALYVVHNSLPYHSAGYATRTHGLVGALRALDWDIGVLTRLNYPFDMAGYKKLQSVPAVDHIDGVPYRRIHSTRFVQMRKPLQRYVARYAKEIAHVAASEGVSLIHAASNNVNGLAAVSAARALRIPSVYEVRGLWEVTRSSRDPNWGNSEEYLLEVRLETDAAKAATRVIAITEALADELVRRGVDARKISVIPNGVDPERFRPKRRNDALASRLKIRDETVIGYIGSIVDYEGLDLLLRASAELRRSGRRFTVLLVGDGPVRPDLERHADALGLSDVVRFTGRVPHEDVPEYYSLIDITPFPRLPLPVCEMVSPLKPFEAMAMSKTVVVSSVAALAEIIVDGETGRIHEKGDPSSLAAVLSALIDRPEEARRMASTGKHWVESNRNWSQLASKVSELYDDLLRATRAE